MNFSCVGEFAVWAISENSGASCVQATTQASSLSDSRKLPTSLRHSSVCTWIGCLSLSAAPSALASSAMVLLQLQTFSVRSSSDISGFVFSFGGRRGRRFRLGLALRFFGPLGQRLDGGRRRRSMRVFLLLVVEEQALRVLERLQHRQADGLALGEILAVRLETFEVLEVRIAEQLLQRRAPEVLVHAGLQEFGVFGSEALERFERGQLARRGCVRRRCACTGVRNRRSRGRRLGRRLRLGRLLLGLARFDFSPP